MSFIDDIIGQLKELWGMSFRTKRPNADTVETIQALHEVADLYRKAIEEVCPNSTDRELALISLRQADFYTSSSLMIKKQAVLPEEETPAFTNTPTKLPVNIQGI